MRLDYSVGNLKPTFTDLKKKKLNEIRELLSLILF